MKAAIISGNSEKDIQLLVSIAEKMGLAVKLLSESELNTFDETQNDTIELIGTDQSSK